MTAAIQTRRLVALHMALSLGIAVAGSILEVGTLATASPLTLWHFQIAFMIISGVTLTAVIPFIAMAKNAGASVSGHRGVPADGETAPVK